MEAVSRILSNGLWQGGVNAPAMFIPPVDLHIACAEESPPSPESGVDVIFLPLVDEEGPWLTNESWCREVLRVAKIAVDGLLEGKQVLVTCYSGWNRSGLVNALALCLLGMSPSDAVDVIRMQRPGALGNRSFVHAIHVLGG